MGFVPDPRRIADARDEETIRRIRESVGTAPPRTGSHTGHTEADIRFGKTPLEEED